jgi:formate hydrogenlyase subunit 4
MSSILITLIQALFVLSLAPLSVGLVRWFKARFQGRHGAAPWLPYLTLATLLKKENIVSQTSSWVFRAAPFTVLSLSIFLALVLPLVGTNGSLADLSNFIVVGGIIMFGAAVLVLAALDVGSSFAGMGASRSLTLASLLEPTFILALAAFALVTHSSTLDGIVSGIDGLGSLLLQAPYLVLSVAALGVVVLGENSRYPVDNPATHLELTMLHEAMILDYSGPYLAMMEYASMLKLTAGVLLIANLILPWPLLNLQASPVDIIIVLAATLIKIIVMMLALALLESTIAKLRFYRLHEFITGGFFLALTGVTIALLSTLL